MKAVRVHALESCLDAHGVFAVVELSVQKRVVEIESMLSKSIWNKVVKLELCRASLK